MASRYLPGYLHLLENNLFEKKIETARELYSPCRLCPRNCKVLRKNDEKGICKSGRDLYIASYNIHFGEEPPISEEKE